MVKNCQQESAKWLSRWRCLQPRLTICFHPRDQFGKRREPATANCPFTSVHCSMHVYIYINK